MILKLVISSVSLMLKDLLLAHFYFLKIAKLDVHHHSVRRQEALVVLPHIIFVHLLVKLFLIWQV